MIFFKDSRNILIIHVGLLLYESTIDSNEHDLWEKNYNVIMLLWGILNSLYFPLSTNTFTHWILIGESGVHDCTPPSQ